MNSLSGFLRKALRSVFIYTRYEVLERDLRVPADAPQPAVAVTWRLGAPADVDRLTKQDHNCDEARKRVLKEALLEGSRFVLAEHEGQIVHVGWIHFHQLVDPGFRVVLADDVCVFHDVRTITAFERKGLHRAGMVQGLQAALDAGAKRSVAIVNVNNRVSYQNFLRGGFTKIGRAHTARLFRKLHFGYVPADLRHRLGTPLDRDAGLSAPSSDAV